MYITYDWIFLISDWCAKIYEHANFNGWVKVIGETTQLDLTEHEENELTSARVRQGCTLNLFKNSNNNWFLGSLISITSDVRYHPWHGHNDQVSSLSCTCPEN